MEGGYTLLLRTIIVESSKTEADPTSFTPPQFDINLKFIFQSFDNDWIIEQDSIRNSRTCSAMTEKKLVVSLSLEQFSDYKGTCEILDEVLKDWRVLDSSREMVVDFVWSITRREIMISMVDEIRVSLQFHLRTVSASDVKDNIDDDAYAATYVMVSSGDDAIKLLEKKKMMMMEGGDGERERCPICLDDLYDTNMSMPCLHVFHADCIKEWLQRSQCCPLCRSQMPISTWMY